MLQTARVVALRMTRGLHAGFPGHVSARGRLYLHPARFAWKHTQVHPPALAFVPACFIPSSSGIFPHHPDSSFILASNFCACLLPRAVCILCSPSFWFSLSLTHLCIPVSYFEIQPDPLPAAPLGRDRPAMAAKQCFAMKKDDPLSVMLRFLVSNYVN